MNLANDADSRLREAWTTWCDSLKQAGEKVLETPCSLDEQAEGLRWITRLTRYGLEAGIEFSDPAFPAFYMPTHETVKIMADNPDATHWMATIRDDLEYVVHGTRGANPRTMFTTLGLEESVGMVQQSGLDTSNLRVEADGTFTIRVSRHPREGNWLPLHKGAVALLARVLYTDRRAQQAPTLRIEQVGNAGVPPRLDAAKMATGLDRARGVALGTAAATRRYADELRSRGWINAFGEKPDSWAAGDPGVAYLHGAWRLGPDEALQFEIEPGECSFWNLQINNRWAESLDYLHRRIHLNSRSAEVGGDGKVRAVLAHSDPGVPNWLDTEGHAEGTMLIRVMDAAAPPRASTRVVPYASLKDL